MLTTITPPAATPAALDPAAMVAVLSADASEEPRILELIEDATALAETLSGQHGRLWYQEHEELIEGTDIQRLYLEARPLASVVSVTTEDGDVFIQGAEPEEFSIYAREGHLYRREGWPCLAAHYVVRYFGGWWLPSMDDPGPKPAEATVVDRAVGDGVGRNRFFDVHQVGKNDSTQRYN